MKQYKKDMSPPFYTPFIFDKHLTNYTLQNEKDIESETNSTKARKIY